METLASWIERERAHAARMMRASVSAVGIVKTRPFFGQSIRPLPGSVVASPVLAAYDPEPDYFFHWFRDAALVVDALRLLGVEGAIARDEAIALLDAYVGFNLGLAVLDGRALVRDRRWRAAVDADHERFVRDDAELAAVHGDAVGAESRVNPDGTIDISRWSRPQHDGAPLTALALLRWSEWLPPGTPTAAALATLLRARLEATLAHRLSPSYDIWEEEYGSHYYIARVSAAALAAGADWLLHGAGGAPAAGDRDDAERWHAAARAQAAVLDGYWRAADGRIASRVLASGAASTKELDIAVILAAIHAGGAAGAHGVDDPRLHATLAQLDAHFDAAYPINRGRAPGTGPALGRYPGDVYYAGGAYFFSTLGAAEFCYRAAAAGDADSAAWLARGDGYLRTVRAYTPASGDLAEQFDQRDGRPASARHLAWSYAAFVSCAAARRAVCG